ncbi:MAG: GcvT family protein, partial [Candidatus Puniceispirillales bacterium]
ISSDHPDVIVVGGGAIGLSIVYHLAHHGVKNILLLERHQLTSGTSWHAAGIVGPLRATPNMTRLATYATELFPRLKDETGQDTGYRRTGGYWLARQPDRHDELRRIAAVGCHFGLHPEMIDNAALAGALPGLDTSGVTLTMAVPEEGSVNPVDLCMAYSKAAKQMGVEIREGVRVDRLITAGDRVTGVALADGEMITAGAVVLATGAWSKPLAASAGLELPLQPVEHMYIVTEPRDEFRDFPVLRDLDRNFYIKGDAGKLLIGVFEPDATCWDAFGPQGDIPFLEMAENWDWFTPYMESALALMPSLADAGIQFYMNGPESFTADTKPLIGPAPMIDGLYVAAGMNSVGVMSSAGVGRLLADWMVDGFPSMDAWDVDIARCDPRLAEPSHMEARMKEAVADNFAIHWPYKQPKAGRGLRLSTLHDHWAKAGAHFGVTATWERPFWFAEKGAEKTLPYAMGDQPWWPIAKREAAAMETGTVLIDLTPFTKIRVSGSHALAGLNRLSTANLDRPPGRAVYTQLLNARGGIEADLTVTRLDDETFRLVSGAATRWRDLATLRRMLPDDVIITDETELTSVIGVMGAGSRDLIRSLSPDFEDGGFGSVRRFTLAGQPVIATRMSFVGECGWEIEVENAAAGTVFDALSEAGAMPMGLLALEGCRMEKGFLHWGHDIGPDITPLEAGLGFTIDWSKPNIASAVLEAQKDGTAQRLVLIEVDGGPMLTHDEPVLHEGRVIGFTTSGGRGPRTGLDLAFALVETAATLIDDALLEVNVAGRMHKAKVLSAPPFDPAGRRMRS